MLTRGLRGLFHLHLIVAVLLAGMMMSAGAGSSSAASIEDLLQAESDKVEVLIAKENFKAAVEPARRLVAKARKLLKPGDPRLVIYGTQLAAIHNRAGNEKKAVATALAVAKLAARSDGDSTKLVDSLARLAGILAKAGKFDAAAQVLNKAIAIAERDKGPDSKEVTKLLRGLTDVYQQMGRTVEAQSLKERLDAAEKATRKRAASGDLVAREQLDDEREFKTEAPPPPPPAGAPAPEPEAPSVGAPAPSAEAPDTDGATAPAPPAKSEPAPKPKIKAARRRAAPAAPATPTEPDVAAASDEQYSVVPVFYGTNRKPADSATRVSFSSAEGAALELGMAMVTVPNSHVVPQLERPWELRVPGTEIVLSFEAQDPSRHFTIKSIETLTADQLVARAKERLAQSKTYQGQALVFVHGFYNTFDDALYRTAQIAFDLQFDGATFMYSWPSAGTLDAYRTDRPKAKRAASRLREFLSLVAKKTGATRVSVIAHSMGNLPLMEALDETLPMTTPSPSASIDEVVLAAPDIGRKEFTTLVEHMKKVRGGVTLYAASNDVALEASRTFFGSEPRAGDSGYGGPLLLPRVDTIDATRVSTQFFRLNHYYVAESSPILCDVEHLLRGGVRPPNERSKILALIKAEAGTYYAYRP
jgi:esterase/lipase superfamily enzyme